MSTALDPVFGCALATGRTDRDGYAFHGQTRAHIHAWTTARGPIASGLELDHLCRRRNCTALHHLELVDRAENERRKSMAYRLRRKSCARGHDLALNRAITPERGVVCRACNREESL
jgi:hypothetical protein